MGFNIKNNYGPNIEVNDGGRVTLVQSKDGLWHTTDAEEAKYEEVVDDGRVMKEEGRMVMDEELFHFIHPAMDEEQERKIHNEVKRLVSKHGVQEICRYLRELERERKVLLPQMASVTYAELVRMGMPQGEGYSEKYFMKHYNL